MNGEQTGQSHVHLESHPIPSTSPIPSTHYGLWKSYALLHLQFLPPANTTRFGGSKGWGGADNPSRMGKALMRARDILLNEHRDKHKHKHRHEAKNDDIGNDM